MTNVQSVIHVVDDDKSFRNAVARLLRAAGYQVALYESGDHLLTNPPGSGPGCILLDMRMSGLSGLELQDRLSNSILPIVFLTGHGDIPTSVRAIKAGASNFLTKPVSKEVLFDAIERAVERSSVVREQQAQLNALRRLIADLTPREHQVFGLVIRGKLNRHIADELGVAERTVKAQRKKVMEKTKAKTVAELVLIAARLGMT